MTATPNTDVAEMLARLRLEFIEGTLERMDGLDRLIVHMRAAPVETTTGIQEVLRHVHSIKGQGGTFDLPAISRISHALEDFVEVSPKIADHELDVIQIFLDRIRRILEDGENPPETAMVDLLRVGRPTAEQIAESQVKKIVEMAIVMPRGIQRKIIAQELGSCGFRVRTADTPTEGLRLILESKPDVVFATMVMSEMSGLDLARALSVIECTQERNVIVLASSTKHDGEPLPKNTRLVHKGPTFSEELLECLVDWGYFGDVRAA